MGEVDRYGNDVVVVFMVLLVVLVVVLVFMLVVVILTMVPAPLTLIAAHALGSHTADCQPASTDQGSTGQCYTLPTLPNGNMVT